MLNWKIGHQKASFLHFFKLYNQKFIHFLTKSFFPIIDIHYIWGKMIYKRRWWITNFLGKYTPPETYPRGVNLPIDNKFVILPHKSLQIAIWLPTKIGILFLFAVKGTRVLQIVKISSHLLSILSYIDK